MKTLLRSLLAPVAVLSLASLLAWMFIQREQRHDAKDRATLKSDSFALRIAAIESRLDERVHLCF